MTPREQTLVAGLSAAASLVADLRMQVEWLTKLLVLYAALTSAERTAARARVHDLALRLAEATRREGDALRALDIAAGRAVLAETALRDALAALPGLRAAAMGTSRARVLEAIAGLEAALGAAEQRRHAA